MFPLCVRLPGAALFHQSAIPLGISHLPDSVRQPAHLKTMTPPALEVLVGCFCLGWLGGDCFELVWGGVGNWSVTRSGGKLVCPLKWRQLSGWSGRLASAVAHEAQCVWIIFIFTREVQCSGDQYSVEREKFILRVEFVWKIGHNSGAIKVVFLCIVNFFANITFSKFIYNGNIMLFF